MVCQLVCNSCRQGGHELGCGLHVADAGRDDLELGVQAVDDQRLLDLFATLLVLEQVQDGGVSAKLQAQALE